MPEVEQRQRLTNGIPGRDDIERRKQGGTAPDFVGLRAPCCDELEKLGAVA